MERQKKTVQGTGYPEPGKRPDEEDAGPRQISYPQCLALVALVLFPAVMMYVAALAAGVPPFREFQSWFTLCGSISVATVLCIFRPGGVAGLWIFCLVVPTVSGLVGVLVWAVFPVSAYGTTLNTLYVAFVLMAYPLIMEFIRTDKTVIRRGRHRH